MILFDADTMMSGQQPVTAGAREESIQQHPLQVAAMNRELRMIVAGGAAERLLIDQLAEAIEEGRIRGRDRNLGQRRFEAECCQLPCGMRQQIDADADRLDFGSGFENAAGNSGLVQRKPERQPADPGANDDDVVHASSRKPIAGMRHD